MGNNLRVGTPAYMSPEQIEDQELTPASDVFSWASTMVYAVTGHQPFGRTSRLGVFWEIQEDEPDLTGVPPEIREIISVALAKMVTSLLAVMLGDSSTYGTRSP
jgi:eukaryotic-like serine/threonine-protein kinase